MTHLYTQYYQALVYFGMKMLHNKTVVQDIVIDSIIKVYNKRYNNIKYTLYLTVRNRCIDVIRRSKRQGAEELDEQQPDIIHEQIEAEVLSQLTKAIGELPDESRQVIELYYYQDKQCIEIGKLLHKPAATVRSIKRYALNKLLNLMKTV